LSRYDHFRPFRELFTVPAVYNNMMRTHNLNRRIVAPRLILAALCGLLALIASPAMAMFAPPQAVPVDRIIANLTKQLEDKPNDPTLLYTLGRVHYLAFVVKSDTVPGWGTGDDFRTAPDWMISQFGYQRTRQHAEQIVLKRRGFATINDVPANQRQAVWQEIGEETQKLTDAKWQPEVMDERVLLKHAEQAKAYLSRAIDAAEDKALATHTLASLYEQQGQRVIHPTNKTPSDELLATRTKLYQDAFNTYRKAYDLAIKSDLAREMMPVSGTNELVSHEAGGRLLGMIEEGKVDAAAVKWTEADTKRVKGELEKLRNLPVRMVTPLIFSPSPVAGIDNLLAPRARVTFDLAGDDTPRTWSWVKPATGILVWDPQGTGEITSGRQLFGAATFWLFWKTGYDALASLDDNADGEIAGDELAGLAVWFDRDGNGVSDAGEVRAIGDTSIAGLRVQFDQRDGRHPMSTRGLRLTDGSTLPTWDWTTDAIK
jgi:tetratricopeptide (TPR) repeat protein